MLAAVSSHARSSATRVRPLAEGDLAQIVDLRRRLFPSSSLSPDHQVRLFRQVFLENPWYEESVSARVCEDHHGRLVGFLGVTARPFRMKDRKYTAAISQHYMVEPDQRSSLAAIQLLKSFLAGPQDLSLTAYAGDVAKQIWNGLGGSTAFVHSVEWARRVSPVTFVTSPLCARVKHPCVGRALEAVSRAADSWFVRRPGREFHRMPPGLVEEPASAADLVAAEALLCDARLFRPVYDEHGLAWLLDMHERRPDVGQLRRAIVRDAGGRLLGWFVYLLRPAGTAEVLQLGGTPDSIRPVLSHLVHHAWKHGALALSGRLDPRFMRAFMQSGLDFLPGLNWMLVHARSADIRAALHEGQCILSGMEADLRLL